MMRFIGERMRMQRQELHMTLDDIAKELGTSRQVIQRYETRVIRNIPLEKIDTIAYLLHVSPLYLLGVTDDKNPEPEVIAEPAVAAVPEEPADTDTTTITVDKTFKVQVRMRIQMDVISVEAI